VQTLRASQGRMGGRHRILLTSYSKYIIKFKILKVRLQQGSLSLPVGENAGRRIIFHCGCLSAIEKHLFFENLAKME